MAMEISYNGNYATTSGKSVRRNGTVSKEGRIYLGRVIDKEKNIFKSRKNGLFMFNPETEEILPVPADFKEPKIKRKKKNRDRVKLCVSFGDLFLLDSFIKEIDFYSVVDATAYRNKDSLQALLAFYCLAPYANSYAESWWELTYARYLYPDAQLASQRISEMLVDIGSEESKRRFFSMYLKWIPNLKKDDSNDNVITAGINDGILIDSTGMPNDAHLPVTAISNHNGVISNETRLIYVIQQDTGIPLYFRYVAGNVIDAVTVRRTKADLASLGITSKFAILDAGYYNGKNADALHEEGIDFLSRLHRSNKIYKQILRENSANVIQKKNLVLFHKRAVYVVCIKCKIGSNEDIDAYTYLGYDINMCDETRSKLQQRLADGKITPGEVHGAIKNAGYFALISTKKVSTDKILPLYYTREQVEDLFKITKGKSKLLPLNLEKEEVLRGHLMMTFMATVINKFMMDKLKSTQLTLSKALFVLHEQKAEIFRDGIHVGEPVKLMNIAYKAFGIKCPVVVDYVAPEWLLKEFDAIENGYVNNDL